MPVQTVEDAAAKLGATLEELGYSEDAVNDLLGEDAYSAGADEVPALLRRLQPGRLATIVELLFLEQPVSREDAERALGRRGLEALRRTELAEADGEVRPLGRIIPVGDLLIAGHGYSQGIDDPPDYVAPFSPTSRILAALTPRPRVRTALDVGTGSGAQALFAAQHAGKVVATDVNETALRFTRLNAALNGLSNVEPRLGSLYEPVAGERFELVTCNAPYVVSPERRWMYRDAGHSGDELSELVVRGAAGHLADGGFAALNVSWLAPDPEEPDERVLEWVEDSGCDAWIFVAWEADPIDHAAGWTADEAGDHDAVVRALDEWLRYLDELGAHWVSEGTVVLRKREGKKHTVRIDSVEADDVEDAPEQIERAFAARAKLADLGRDELLQLRPTVAATLRFEEELVPGRGLRDAVVSLAEGTFSAVDTTPEAMEVVARLDGSTTLEEAIGTADGTLRRDAVKLVRELLELGALSIS